MKLLLYPLFALLATSCIKQSETDAQIEKIKILSNTNPASARIMYKSLDTKEVALSKHVQMKYNLLGIRLDDKNDIKASSDSAIIPLIEYFEDNGSNMERQEMYYYAGSVYRDLQDAPRSLNYFLNSAETSLHGEVDSLILRNCYSQLSLAFSNVQNYKQALWAATEECRIAENLGILDDLSLTHISNAYIRLREDSLALKVMDPILEHQAVLAQDERDYNVLFDLLYSYSFLQNISSATVCHNLIKDVLDNNLMSTENLLAVAMFNYINGNLTSCINNYKKIMDTGNISCKYDASKELYQIYNEIENRDSAYKYAEKFLEYSTKLDLGLRQELAATTNNQFRYYKNKMLDDKMRYDNERYKHSMYLSLSITLLLLVTGLALHYYMRYRRIKILLSLTDSLSETRLMTKEKKQMNEGMLINEIKNSISSNKTELTNAKDKLKQSLKEAQQIQITLNQVEEKLEESGKKLQTQKELVHEKINELTIVSLQLQQSKKELSEKNTLLNEKKEQNKHLYMILHQATLEGEAKDILADIKTAADGRTDANQFNWKEFMTVMDTLYPEFSQEMYDRLGKLKPKQTETCYLLKAGFSNSQIQNLITGVSRATIWRWTKIYRVVLSDVINK